MKKVYHKSAKHASVEPASPFFLYLSLSRMSSNSPSLRSQPPTIKILARQQ